MKEQEKIKILNQMTEQAYKMTGKPLRFTRHSNCCNEEVTVIGEVTKYYQCNNCKQPCDTKIMEDERS